MSELKREHVEWTRQLFTCLSVGGMWAYPAAGLIFRKQSSSVVVCECAMPHQPEMPMTSKELREHQDKCLEGVVEHALAAGFVVLDERDKKKT